MDNTSIYSSLTIDEPLESSWRICRICLSKVTDQDVDPIFEPLTDGYTIAEILEAISDIKLEKDYAVPKWVCKNCSKIIFDFRYLVKTFYDSEEYFKATLSKKEFVAEKLEISQEELQQCDNPSNESVLFDNDDNEDIDSVHEETPFQDCTNNSNDISLPFPTQKDCQASDNSQNDVNKDSIENDKKVFDEQTETQEVPAIKYTCDICGDCFLFKSGFGHHMLMVHNICIQVNQYEQYSSEITIKVPKGLPEKETRFVRKCNPTIPLYKTEVQCKKCKETFTSVEALKEHNEVHKTFRCDQCGAAFIKNSYLRDHLLKHSADKCYSCKDCGQAFKYRSALAIHRREHGGTNTGHMCETCGRNFKERGTLKTHIMLKHTNERNFPCSGCDLTFKLKAARDKHYLRKHTFNRTKDFVCSTCGIAYLNKETLTRHMADKHTGTPSVHWCNVCHKSFTMKSNLAKHLRNKHNVITKKEQF